MRIGTCDAIFDDDNIYQPIPFKPIRRFEFVAPLLGAFKRSHLLDLVNWDTGFLRETITALAENYIAHLRCLVAQENQSVPALKADG